MTMRLSPTTTCGATRPVSAGIGRIVHAAPPASENDGTVSFEDREAWLLRENTDEHRLVKVARKVAEVLAHWNIPHLIVGGLAAQEHGYPRFTIDVDVIVPDVLAAAEFLTADLTGPSNACPARPTGWCTRATT